MRHKLVSHPSRVAFTKAMEETFCDWFGACMPGANSGQRLVPRTLEMCEVFPVFTWLLPPQLHARAHRELGAQCTSMTSYYGRTVPANIWGKGLGIPLLWSHIDHRGIPVLSISCTSAGAEPRC